MTAAVPAAVWRGWYHLFLPRWLPLKRRLLIVFSDELQAADPSAALRRLWEHVRIGPPVLGEDRPLGERRGRVDAPRGSPPEDVAWRFNVSARAVVQLRELTADSIGQTDALLRAAGRAGVPGAWRAKA